MKKILFSLLSIGMITGCSKDDNISDNYIPALVVTITSEAEEESLRSQVEDKSVFDGKAKISPTGSEDGSYIIYVAPEIRSLPAYAFSWCDYITSVDFVENVLTTIEENAFIGCSSMAYVHIPGVISIGNEAFRSCVSLKSISIPQETTFLGDYAFKDCKSLANITFFDNSITTIGDSVFMSCDRLNIIKIPYGVTSIGSSAFWGCDALNMIDIPGSVTSIEDEAFQYCTSLTSIDIPSSVTYIGNNVFNYSAIKEIYCHPTIPPTLGGPTTFGPVNTIYVPRTSVTRYKEYGGNWRNYQNRIMGWF